MRATRLHRLMHGLAFAATLALVVVPPLGRVFQAVSGGAGHHAVASPAAMPAAMASHHAHHAMAAAPAASKAPEPHQHPRDGDCDYCPLLTSMLGSAAPSLLATVHLAPVAPPFVQRAAIVGFRHPAGLGSRGPPTLA